MKGLIDFQVTRWFSDAFRAANPEVVQHCVDVFLTNELPAYAETCRMLGAHDARALLSAIACPTRIVVGEEDYATPVTMARELQQRHQDFPVSGHRQGPPSDAAGGSQPDREQS